ncbi:MAG: AraC family transcriptional regulator [Pyrinomonadaceae bacterium]
MQFYLKQDGFKEHRSGWRFGKILKSASISGHGFTETVYAPSAKLDTHSHEFPYLCFVLKGDLTERSGRKENLYNASNLIFHPANESHSNYFHTESRCFNIRLDSKTLQNTPCSNNNLDSPQVFRSGSIIYLVTRLYKEICQPDEFSDLTVQGLVLEILAETFRASSNEVQKIPPRWLCRIKDLIDEDFAADLTLDGIAGAESVHPTHLAREFRRYFDHTIGDYIRKKRIEFSCLKLAGSGTPIKEIALEAGFFDQSHFTRVFKKATGTTPSAYRQIFSVC